MPGDHEHSVSVCCTIIDNRFVFFKFPDDAAKQLDEPNGGSIETLQELC